MTDTLLFTGEIVTPLFMNGVDPQEPKIRATSIRGVIKKWVRIILSNFNYETYLNNDLNMYINNIFGGTIEDKKIRRSPTRFRVEIEEKLETLSYYKIYKGKDNIIKYLSYGLGKTNNRRERHYINAGPKQKFKLKIDINPIYSKYDIRTIANILVSSVWLSSYLGGYGARSSRGFGSIIFNFSKSELTDLVFPQKNDLFSYYENSIKEIINWRKKQEIYKNINEYKTGQNDFIKIYFLNGIYENWKDLLNEIGEILLRFRKYNSEGKKIKSLINGKKKYIHIAVPKFGLPINFYFRSIGKVRLIGIENKNELITRWASPLKIKAIKYQGLYYPLLIYYKNRVFEGKYDISIRGITKSNKKDFQIFTDKKPIIEDFIEYIDEKYGINNILFL